MPTFTCPTPENINPLRLGAYQFSIQKLPSLTYFVTKTEIPSIQLGMSSQSSSVHDIKIPGETMEYSQLQVEFQVDENMENWNSIYFWIHGLGYPEDNDVYAKFLNSSINAQSYTESAKGYQDASLTILDSSNNPKQIFTFIDMFPISLQGLSFDSTSGQNQIAVASATFEYTLYTINKPPPV